MSNLQIKPHSKFDQFKMLINSTLEKRIVLNFKINCSIGEAFYEITMRTEEVILFNNLQDIIDFLESCLGLNKNTNSFCLVMPVPIHFNGEIVNQHSV